MKNNFQFSIFPTFAKATARRGNFQNRAGFTIFEIMLAITLAAVVVTIVLLSFSKMNEKKALDASSSLVVSAVDEARSLTLSGIGGTQYGVHLGEGSVVLFVGATYSDLDSRNIVSELHSLTGIRNITLSGGGIDIVFNKLDGTTFNAGTFEVFLRSDPARYKTVSVNSNGIAEEN